MAVESLEAKVTVPSAKLGGCGAMDTEELADLFIVSQVEAGGGTEVQVAPAQGSKCMVSKISHSAVCALRRTRPSRSSQ